MSIKYKRNQNIKDFYEIGGVVGEGSFAVVKKGIDRETGMAVAIKIIDKTNLEPEDEASMQAEVEVLSQIDHPNVVRLFEIVNNDDKLYMVLEFMEGGELFDRIVEREQYSEKEAAETLRPIVDAIRYCHSIGIVHRDLKPENVLYSSADLDATVKISDFGLARFISPDLMSTACGTPGYIAPEVLEGGYGPEIDYWSIGVILYILLCGFPPFCEDDDHKLYDMIKNATFDFPSPHWDHISGSAKDLINRLLVADPSKRLNSDEILNHPWLSADHSFDPKLPSVTEKIKEYYANRRIKKRESLMLRKEKNEHEAMELMTN